MFSACCTTISPHAVSAFFDTESCRNPFESACSRMDPVLSPARQRFAPTTCGSTGEKRPRREWVSSLGGPPAEIDFHSRDSAGLQRGGGGALSDASALQFALVPRPPDPAYTRGLQLISLVPEGVAMRLESFEPWG